MARTSSIYARVEPQIKDQAEEVLERLGIPMSNAIDCFLRQIVYQQRIPFEIKLPRNLPVMAAFLTDDELHSELERGLEDVQTANLKSADSVRNTLTSKYGL